VNIQFPHRIDVDVEHFGEQKFSMVSIVGFVAVEHIE
jgi:hypothetical protein